MSERALKGYTPSFDGTRIFYEIHDPEDGAVDPTPIVFCYGLVCAMTHWRYQLANFKRTHRCILLDYRAHHKSGMPDDEKQITVANCAKDVLAVMDHLELAKPHVVTHSMGTNVAVVLAHEHPERVKSLVSICGSSVNPFQTMLHTSALHHVFEWIKLARQKDQATVDALWRGFSGNNIVSRAIVALAGFNRKLSTLHDIEIYLEGVQNIPLGVLQALLDDMSRNPVTELLPEVQTPALIISGEKDHIQPPQNQQTLYEKLPNAQWLSIPYGSHCAHVDMHEFVNLRIEKFFNEVEAGKKSKARAGVSRRQPQGEHSKSGAPARRRPKVNIRHSSSEERAFDNDESDT